MAAQSSLKSHNEVCFLSPSLLLQLSNSVQNFKAGQVSEHLQEWVQLTSDPEILRIVQGDIILFESEPPERQTVRKCNVVGETKNLMHEEVFKYARKENYRRN